MAELVICELWRPIIPPSYQANPHIVRMKWYLLLKMMQRLIDHSISWDVPSTQPR
jgi:hypothetical protein